MDLTCSLADYFQKTPRELHYFVLTRGFEQRISADDLFRLCERAVRDRDFAAGALMDANARRTEIHSLGCNEPSRLHALFDELAHRCHFGFRRGAVRWFVGENADEAHVYLSSEFNLPATLYRTARRRFDNTAKFFL